jgi:glycine betaine transporter
MILSFLIMLLVLILGPTSTIFNVFFDSMGAYVNDFVQMSLRLVPWGDDGWFGSWTLFYWAWWISWSPFVGMFIARVSKGRTVKEFVFGVLIVPTVGTCVWFAIFGGSALDMVQSMDTHELAKSIASNTSLSIFTFFNHLPLSLLLSIIGFVVVATYYVTVADTSTFVLGMLSEGGKLDPSVKSKIIWGVIQSGIAAVLLIAGGLKVLQSVSLVAAFPFAILMVILCFSLLKGLKSELHEDPDRKTAE